MKKIFPLFVFIIGMSMNQSIAQNIKDRLSRIQEIDFAHQQRSKTEKGLLELQQELTEVKLIDSRRFQKKDFSNVVALTSEEGFSSFIKLDSMEIMEWNDGTEEHENYIQYAYYDELGQLVEFKSYLKTDVGNKIYDRNVYFYDKNGRDSLLSYMLWDERLSEWDEVIKIERSYDGDKLLKYTSLNWLEATYLEIDFDEYGNQKRYARSFWDDDASEWVESYLVDYVYDNAGNQLYYARYVWSESESTLIGDTKVEREVNAQKELVTSIEFEWNGEINDWIQYSKIEYTYDDETGEREGYNYLLWYEFTEQWIVEDRVAYDYEYNSSGMMISKTAFIMEDGVWTKNWLYEYGYDEEGNITSEITSVGYDSFSGFEWIYYVKNEYAYEAGRQTVFAEYYWDYFDTEVWVNESKYEYSYNYLGDELLYILYEGDGDDWKALYKREHAYDENGNELIYRISELVDDSFWNYDLEVTHEELNYYSPYFEQTAEIPMQEVTVGETIAIDLADYFNLYDTRNISYEVTTAGEGIVNATIQGSSLSIEGMKEDTSDSVKVMMQLSPGDALELSFAVNVLAKPLGIDVAQDVVVYPNPAQDYLIIKESSDVSSWIVLDIEGKKIDSGSFAQRKIDVTNYKAGVYVIRLQDQSSIKEFKFIKQ